MTFRAHRIAAVFAVLALAACHRQTREPLSDASTTSAELPVRSERDDRDRVDAAVSTAAVSEPVVDDAGADARPPPAWVPTADRLSIVGASDLAKNLGLVDADGGAIAAPPASPPPVARRLEEAPPEVNRYEPPSAADRIPRTQFGPTTRPQTP